MSDAFRPLLARLADGATLSEADAEQFFTACLRGEPTSAQVAAALTAMRLRGETIGEITACARAMRRSATRLEHPIRRLSTPAARAATAASTYNVSTAAALVAAGGGLKVAKHGNRALSSRSGSSDVTGGAGGEARRLRPASSRRALEQAGICFLFAHRPSRRHAPRDAGACGAGLSAQFLTCLAPCPTRRERSARCSASTTCGWSSRWRGCSARSAAERAWVVHGSGLDELTTTGPSEIAEWRDGAVRLFRITPEAVGLPVARIEDLQGGEPAENAAALLALLDGRAGAYRDIVLLNTAAAFLVAGVEETLEAGVARAAAAIDDGRARGALDKLVQITNTPEP